MGAVTVPVRVALVPDKEPVPIVTEPFSVSTSFPPMWSGRAAVISEPEKLILFTPAEVFRELDETDPADTAPDAVTEAELTEPVVIKLPLPRSMEPFSVRILFPPQCKCLVISMSAPSKRILFVPPALLRKLHERLPADTCPDADTAPVVTEVVAVTVSAPTFPVNVPDAAVRAPAAEIVPDEAMLAADIPSEAAMLVHVSAPVRMSVPIVADETPDRALFESETSRVVNETGISTELAAIASAVEPPALRIVCASTTAEPVTFPPPVVTFPPPVLNELP